MNNSDTITTALEDIIIHHIFLDDFIILGLAVLVFYLFIKKDLDFFKAIVFDSCLLALEVINVFNGARLYEWANWYVDDGYLVKMILELRLEQITGVLIIIAMIAKYFLWKKKEKKSHFSTK